MKPDKVVLTLLIILLVAGCAQKPNEEKIVINEALRTLLYLPLYHAKEGGFFEKNGLNVEIITGGTATNSFAAMLSDEAQFSQADPMYVPISNEKGSNTRVVAQVVARIAVWGVTKDTAIDTMDAQTMKGKSISTHPRPMTAYTYAVKTIEDAGLQPDKDVKILESTPGTEIGPLLSGQSDFALTLEPNVSKAVKEGAKVVLSYPDLLGDQIFTGLMTKQSYIESHEDIVKKVVLSYQQALDDIYKNTPMAIETAKKYFPQVDHDVIEMAVKRMIDESVIPKSVIVSSDSWDKAIRVRVDAGDLKHKSTLQENYTLEIAN